VFSKKYLKFILVASFTVLLVAPHRASAVDWFPLVPCGLNVQPTNATRMDTLPDGTQVPHDYTQSCNQCLLIELGKNVIDMTFFAIVPSVGTLLFMIAGFIILFNAREGKAGGVAKGREIMTNTAIGIAIILGAWLITNFILKSIANDQVAGTPWYQIECKVGTLKDIVLGALPPPSGPAPVPQKYSCSTSNNTCVVDSTGEYTTNTCDGKCPPALAGAQCLQSGLNLCTGASSTGCANSSCSQYSAMITRQATGVATASVLKAFMEIESSCNINPPGGGSSYGLMQLTPPIPEIYGTRCKDSSGNYLTKAEVNGINQAWLTNPANAEKSICISAQWINAVADSKCGSSIRNLYAGYNGGQNGACAPSVSCAGEKSCSNEPVKRWECLYDDTAHKVCNGGTNIMAGYNPTRLGATKIQYCVANPGF